MHTNNASGMLGAGYAPGTVTEGPSDRETARVANYERSCVNCGGWVDNAMKEPCVSCVWEWRTNSFSNWIPE